MTLRSKSKPREVTTESLETPAARRNVTESHTGSEPDAPSRAAATFVRVGRSEVPLTPRFAAAPVAVETVIHHDDRQRILETDLSPWRRICALNLIAPDGSRAIGTGWLAGPQTVLTAGHCVHDRDVFGGWASSIDISAGRDGAHFPFGTVTAVRFSALDRWVDTADPDFDIGCIHLDEPLGERVGWFAVGSVPPSELEHHLANICGYPADLGAGTEQYFHENRILHIGPHRVFYDVDTYGGQSGSPVWIQETANAEPIAVGIHAYGTRGTPFHLGISANSAPRITPAVFEIVRTWIADDTPAPPE